MAPTICKIIISKLNKHGRVTLAIIIKKSDNSVHNNIVHSSQVNKCCSIRRPPTHSVNNIIQRQ